MYYQTQIIELVSYLLYPLDHRLDRPKGINSFIDALKDIRLDFKWVTNEDVADELGEG